MKRRLTCAVLALCLLLSGCAATGTTSPQRYSVTWWDVFDTVTVISGYADSEADWNTQMTALHADLLRYNQLYDIYNHYGCTRQRTVPAMPLPGRCCATGTMPAPPRAMEPR